MTHKYASYRFGKGFKQPVRDLLSAPGVIFTNGGGLKELEQLQNYLSFYKIIVLDGLNHDMFMLIESSLWNKN